MSDGVNAADCRSQIYRRGEPITWLAALKDDKYDAAINYYQRGESQNGDKAGVIYTREPISDTLYGLWGVTTDIIDDPVFGVLPVGTAQLTIMPNECPVDVLDRFVRVRGQLVTSNAMQRVTLVPNAHWGIVASNQPQASIMGPVQFLSYTFSGAGTDAYNVAYTESGWLNGVQYFSDVSGTYFLYWVLGTWYIGTVLGETSTGVAYKVESTSLLPPLTGWGLVGGASPAPTSAPYEIVMGCVVSGAGTTVLNGNYPQSGIYNGYPVYTSQNGIVIYAMTLNDQTVWCMCSTGVGNLPTYTVLGSGMSEVNETFTWTGGYGQTNYFSNGTYYLFFDIPSQAWYISTVLGNTADAAYFVPSSFSGPPSTGWQVLKGTAPAPTSVGGETVSYANPFLMDALPIANVRGITSVIQGATTYVQGTDFSLLGNSIWWLPGGNAPLEGSTYSARFTYAPVYQWLGVSDQTTWADSDGNLMPHRSVVRLLTLNEPNTQN